MDSFDDLDFFYYSFESAEFLLPNPSSGADIGFLPGNVTSQANECLESDSRRKRSRDNLFFDEPVMDSRARKGSCEGSGSKACRERLRRERLNERFLELSSILEQGRPAKNDNKSAILDDAIRLLTQLRAEAQNLEERNEKLREEIKSLMAEKNKLRKEKSALKADKEKMEQQLKTMMPVFPGYGFVPMWQYLPPSVCDTSQDHEHRPPAA